jgi:HEAT repeat protein
MIFRSSGLNETPLADSANDDAALRKLAHRLRSLHDGDVAVVEAATLGAKAIPVLRELLFEVDPAGIFEPRQRAVQALAALGACDVLSEFIATWEAAADPVQRTGDEAVLSAAARALAAAHSPEAFGVLLAAARKHTVAGLIEALGEYRRAETVPILAEALEDDVKRPAAQEALRKLGQDALPALVEIASYVIVGRCGRETASGIRRRRSALELLLELGPTPAMWEKLRRFTDDANPEVAALACRIGMAAGDQAAKRACAQRLISLLAQAAWFSRQEIEDSLSENFTFAREAVEVALRNLPDSLGDNHAQLRLRQSLQRIKSRASAAPRH